MHEASGFDSLIRYVNTLEQLRKRDELRVEAAKQLVYLKDVNIPFDEKIEIASISAKVYDKYFTAEVFWDW